MVGVNLIFYGCKLFIIFNLDIYEDVVFFKKLGINIEWMCDYFDEVYELLLEEVLE